MYQRLNYILVAMFFLAFTSCQRDEDYLTPQNPHGSGLSSIIRFTSVPGATPADSFSQAMISVLINPQTDTLGRQVTISSSLGHFSNNDTTITVTADAYGMVSTPLISDKAGTATIRASVSIYPIDTTLIFSMAYPTDLTLSTDKYVMDTTEAAALTCTLFRDNGTPTDPSKVSFVIKPDTDTVLSLIAPPFVYTTAHAATCTLSNPYHSQGWFTVTASTLGASNDTIRRSIRIQVR